MKFRTEVDIRPSDRPLSLNDSFLTLGSCFSSAIGSRLEQAGVDINVNPLGVLFNPVSIANIVRRAFDGRPFDSKDLFRDSNGIYHLLALESRRQSADANSLLDSVNADFAEFTKRLRDSNVLLVTFGTSWCFHHIPTDSIVGNCHKLPDSDFYRTLIDFNKLFEIWQPLAVQIPRLIVTVSPVRHLNDGLHGNTLSKAHLHLLTEQLARFDNVEYFPAFEALNDDLRDYRFYADDLKHPSTMAEEYIFDLFTRRYFSDVDRATLSYNRKKSLQALHRPIIK